MAATGLKNRRFIATLVLAAVVALVPLAVWMWGRNSDQFAVRRIELRGEKPAHTRELGRALRESFAGENLFRIGVDDVREAFSPYPYVADVAVDRDFPRTLRVLVTEFRPAALLESKGRWYVVSSEGRVISELACKPSATPSSAATGASPSPQPSSASPAASPAVSASSRATATGPPAEFIVPQVFRTLPAITTGVPVEVGGDAGGADPDVATSLAILGSLPWSLRKTASEADAGQSGAWVRFTSGLKVEFGDADDLENKNVALAAVLRVYRKRHVTPTFVDVSVPHRPLGAPVLAPSATP